MNNDNLFDSIRDKLNEAESATSPEWNRDKVWERIQQRSHQGKRHLIRWYAAAGISLLLIGNFLWFRATKNELVASSISRVTSFPKATAPVKTYPKNTKKYTKFNSASAPKMNPAPIRSAFSAPDLEGVIDQPKEEMLATKDSIASQPATSSPAPATASSQSKSEPASKTLIVDLAWDEPISLPSPVETTFRERLRIQAMRLKTQHKFDLRSLDKRPGNGIWSFVGQSFVEPSTSKQ